MNSIQNFFGSIRNVYQGGLATQAYEDAFLNRGNDCPTHKTLFQRAVFGGLLGRAVISGHPGNAVMYGIGRAVVDLGSSKLRYTMTNGERYCNTTFGKVMWVATQVILNVALCYGLYAMNPLPILFLDAAKFELYSLLLTAVPEAILSYVGPQPA